MSIDFLNKQHLVDEVISQDVSLQINSLLQKHYKHSLNFDNKSIKELQDEFQENSYIKISKFVPPAIETSIKGEVYNLLDRYAVRKEIFVEETNNTPRFMSVVRQVDIAREGKIIPKLYYSKVFTNFISKLVGEDAIFCPFENEKFVISRMSQPGDTHGWHWDDYSYSLIWFVECPPSDLGGALQFIPNTSWDKSNPKIDYYLSNYPVQTKTHVAGDAYILKADTSMHRVEPIKENAVRVMLALTWASAKDLEKTITHETMNELYVD